jgi:hypothetical protein
LVEVLGGDLVEVLDRLAEILIAARDRAGQRQEALDQGVACPRFAQLGVALPECPFT